ncbi:MAG: hypothetical protein LRS47_02900 [Desulfurococcales archaeon]|nr:hypothetical protein [Desulfurococcales archaeon]
MTAKVELGRRFDLHEVARKLGRIYYPDYHPYTIVRLNDTMLIVFQNSRIVLLGVRSLEDTYSILGKALALLT